MARRSNTAPTPPLWASSGRAFPTPPAHTSCIEMIGFSPLRLKQAVITSWQRRCISGFSLWTDAKSRAISPVPRFCDEAFPPPSPTRSPGHPSWTKSVPTGNFSTLCTFSGRTDPIPPASIIGLW